eukprot:913040-Pelagomonas_calceolata.AAC.2
MKFNAHVGVLSKVSDAHYDLLWTVLDFFYARCVCVCPNVSKAGRLLVDLATATSTAVTAGHAPRESRLMSDTSLGRWTILHQITAAWAWSSKWVAVQEARIQKLRGTMCVRQGCVITKTFCIGTMRRLLLQSICEAMRNLSQFEAGSAGDVEKLAFCVRSLIVQAASNRGFWHDILG